MDVKRPILVISDLQIPFEASKALEFCINLKKEFRIPTENIVCVGDEIDNFHGSAYPKDPDAPLSAVNEFEITRERIKAWAKAFPLMRVCISNHGIRWIRKAVDAQIPTQVLRAYHEIFQIPKSWQYREEWRFNSLRHPFRVVHGMGYSGPRGHINAAIDAGGFSTVIGHLHSHAAVNFIQTNGGARFWAVNTGCLIDVEAFAFKYEKYNRVKPQLGATVVIDQGKTPIFIPY